jgi:hypothetical protein
VPAFLVYIVLIMALALLIVLLAPRLISVRKDVETRFQESLVEVKGNHGDVLEVATYKSTAYFTEEDRLDLSFVGLTVPLGTTEAFLMAPVTYRFHVLLSDKWRIRTTPETVTVFAPEIRPSLPPAPDISLMEVRSERGWARLNRQEVEDRVRSMVTASLTVRAAKLARSQLVRDVARGSVERSLRNWIPWLPAECRSKVFTVRFGDEADGDNATGPAGADTVPGPRR